MRKNQSQLKTGLLQYSLERSTCVFLAKAVLLVSTAAGAFLLPVAAAQNSAPTAVSYVATGVSENTTIPAKIANFEHEVSSPEAKKLADWVMDSSDNAKLPFIIIDKVNARVFVFNAQGQLTGASVALLGLAVGDDSVPGIGQQKLSTIRPAERTTPAGRFPRPRYSWPRSSLGGLRFGPFTPSRSEGDAQRTPRTENGVSVTSRKTHFLWLHQCASQVL
jgi:hypothetical protein